MANRGALTTTYIYKGDSFPFLFLILIARDQQAKPVRQRRSSEQKKRKRSSQLAPAFNHSYKSLRWVQEGRGVRNLEIEYPVLGRPRSKEEFFHPLYRNESSFFVFGWGRSSSLVLLFHTDTRTPSFSDLLCSIGNRMNRWTYLIVVVARSFDLISGDSFSISILRVRLAPPLHSHSHAIVPAYQSSSP